MRVTIQEVLDYIHCSQLHKYKYKDKVDVMFSSGTKLNQHNLSTLFDQEVHKLGYHIFNYVQDNKYPSEYLLRLKWGQLWLKNKTVIDVIFDNRIKDSNKTNPMTYYEKLGLRVIKNMIPKFKENPGIPLLVGKVVEIPIGRHMITVTIDLVREIIVEGKPVIEMLDFQSGVITRGNTERTPMNLHIHQDIKMTAASLALKQLTTIPPDIITYYDMINDKEYSTSRSESDYLALENVLNHVETSIDAGIHYPVMNDRCMTCAYQKECQNRDWYATE